MLGALVTNEASAYISRSSHYSEASVSNYLLLHISNLFCKTNWRKLWVTKDIYSISLKNFCFISCNYYFFSKWHINELFCVVKDPCVFKFSFLHLSTQSCLFFSAGHDSFLRTSIILILVLCSHKYTTPSW